MATNAEEFDDDLTDNVLAEHSERPQKEPMTLSADCPAQSAEFPGRFSLDSGPATRRRQYRYLGQVDFPEPTHVYQKPEAGIPSEILG